MLVMVLGKFVCLHLLNVHVVGWFGHVFRIFAFVRCGSQQTVCAL